MLKTISPRVKLEFLASSNTHLLRPVSLQAFGSTSWRCATPSATWRADSREPRTTSRKSKSACGPGPAPCSAGRTARETCCSAWRTGPRDWTGSTLWCGPPGRRSTSCWRWVKKKKKSIRLRHMSDGLRVSSTFHHSARLLCSQQFLVCFESFTVIFFK